jgi:hypothetical protein
MDASGYIAALIGLIGVAIGSASSIATMIIQARVKDKRDRAKQVTDMALAQFKMALDLATSGKGPPNVPPLVTYIHYYDLILKAVEERTFTPEKFREITALAEEMHAVVIEGEK